MSTRASERALNWQRIYKKTYSSRIASARFDGLPGHGSQVVLDFSPGGITLLCGRNSSGKTQIVRALLRVLSARPDQIDGASVTWRVDVAVDADGFAGGTEFKVTEHFRAGHERTQVGPLPSVVWVDPALHCAAMANHYSTIKDLDELLAAHEARVWTRAEVDQVNFVMRREYERIEAFEIDDFEGVPNWPYFKVWHKGESYGTEAMGLGELCVFFLLWRLTAAGSGAICVVEEPESFLVPSSQMALADALASISLHNDLWMLVTTHSPEFVRRVPLANIRLIERDSRGTRCLVPKSVGVALVELGLSPIAEVVLLVEDSAAESILRAILVSDRARDWTRVSIRNGQSADNIVRAIRAYPHADVAPHLRGVLDGDQKHRKEVDGSTVLCLPTDGSPEHTLIETGRKNSEALAGYLSRNHDETTRALSQVEGLDRHDQIEELAKRLKHQRGRVMDDLVRVWLDAPSNQAAAAEFCRALASAVGPLPG